MKNKLHIVLVVLGLLLAVLAAWWLQRPSSAPGASSLLHTGAAAPAGSAPRGAAAAGPAGPGGPVAVEVGRVERARLEDDAQAVGSLRSNQGVMLRPEVSGRIVKLAFADGQRVQRGALLVQLDDTLQQAQLQQSQAQAGIARTNLQRSRELLAQNFISQSAVDQNAAALDVAQAQVALSQAQLQRMRVLAPFDGVLGIRAVNVGDYVKDGADLVTVDDVSSMWVDFRLPERYLPKLKPGQAVAIDLDALPGQRVAGRIGALDAQLDANGRSVLVRARVPNADGRLRSGMFARARVLFEVREGALLVPEEALVPMAGKQFVIKVIDAPQGGKLARRIEARLGQRANGKVELLAGVAEGDVVVLAGQARLMRGDDLPVRVVDLARPAGAPRPASGAASGPGMGPAMAANPASRAQP
ncbi:efflux RND transporter periplasmic adaptor subunit [Aquabacterium sp. OR-4]|uniref:efflux RND transporter periplasmic adaptor subunit n=1 Tax=Aquabacterium sp. OR-4 TaxID=2978127 RepID=UPI0021B40782|nr:efflux RND transporter periplasmic adaptor subunit [Aquabacterium sp. OR-4]MDT7836660.1 efflux RND transporter periplasmic adaptor subunit [Aquabacterium sp. OR-4]